MSLLLAAGYGLAGGAVYGLVTGKGITITHMAAGAAAGALVGLVRPDSAAFMALGGAGAAFAVSSMPKTYVSGKAKDDDDE